MAKYRAGIIGVGRRGDFRGGGYGIAEAHTWGYEANDNTEIVAAADISPENLAIYCDEHHVPGRYSDYHEMLAREHLDIVSVCTWPQLHAQMVIDAAQAGVKGILCEKPMALTIPDARRMVETCEARGVRLSIDHQRRLGEPFGIAKAIAHSGEIGELLQVAAYVGGSNLYDWGTHWLDMLFFYNDEAPAEWVMAQIEVRRERELNERGFPIGFGWGMRIDTQSLIEIQYRNGVRGLLETGLDGWPQVVHRLIGSEGYVEILRPNPDDPNQPTVRARVKGRAEWLVPATTESIHARQNFNRSVADLVRAIDEGHESELSGRRAYATTEVILAAYESAWRRGKVRLPLEIDYSPLPLLVEAAEKVS